MCWIFVGKKIKTLSTMMQSKTELATITITQKNLHIALKWANGTAVTVCTEAGSRSHELYMSST